MNSKKINGSILLDLKHAFDTIDDTILIESFRDFYVKLLPSFVTASLQCVSFNPNFPIDFY